MARRAGVAISTVSKVFSGRGEVIPALRVRVLAAAAELGYQPNYIAQSLRRGATDLIGFAAADLSDPFSAAIIAGAETVLRPAGYGLLVMSSNYDPDVDAANVRYLNSRRVDAVLVLPSREDDPRLLAALTEFDGPVVAIESAMQGLLPVDAICADHRGGMRAAVEHLVALGHRRIAALTGPMGRRSARERAAGLVEGLRAHHLDDRSASVATEHDAKDAEAATLDLLGRAAPPTALLAGGGPLLIGALRAIRRSGFAIGRDLALVGWDDSALCELAHPPIAVVDRDAHGLGGAAASLALKRVGHGSARETGPPLVEILPTRFIPRASCMALDRRKFVDSESASSGGSIHG
ncbi:MAG: LacI family DNA-binding transcriptional regulator [Bauldia sp.]